MKNKNLKFTLEESDIDNFLNSHLYEVNSLIYILIFWGIMALIGLFLYLSGTGVNYTILISIIAGLFVIGAIYALSIYYKRVNKKAIMANSDFFLEQEIIITNEGLVTSNPNGKYTYTWDRLTEVINTKGNFIIKMTGNQMIIVPKRLFSEQGEKDFEQALNHFIAGSIIVGLATE